MVKRFGTALSLVALLSACGGGGSSGNAGGTPAAGAPTGGTTTAPAPPPSATPASAQCSLRARQDWAAQQLNEWYLFPETLPANPTPTQGSVQEYVDALTATARAQGRDRFFTYLTSISQENAFYQSGSSAGFGFRLSTDTAARRIFVAEAFEGTAALAAGIDRGTEIVGIGPDASSVRTVNAILAAEGEAGFSNALGPATAGTTRVLRIADAQGTRDVRVTKTDYELTPVSSRYGFRIIEDAGKRVGYVNLRTFISPADPQLRAGFAQLRAQGVTEVIVDLRYNGGGLVAIAELMGDLLGRDRSPSDVFSFTTFRPSKASNNSTRFFRPQAESIAPMRLAFIGTGGTASASELLINAFIPYLRERSALIGTNTYGKPVGQIALDRPACDDRLRVIAFATQNAERQGEYFQGLAPFVRASCRAPDDLTKPFGDPQEGSTRQALDFLAGKSCTPIAGVQGGQAVRDGGGRQLLLSPDQPTASQREVPGSF